VTVPAADLAGLPEHVRRLVTNAGQRPWLRTERPSATARRSAVLILFGEGPAGPDVLLIEKSPHLRSHAGQPAFPGGGADPGDDFPVGTALREAHEEAGVAPDGVRVLAVLPEFFLGHSDNLVVPVVGWWDDPREVSTGDPHEVARVARVPLAELVDPANRFRVRIPSGYVGPAFGVAGMVVWGFTAGLLDSVLAAAGLDRPWDTTDVRPLATPAGGPEPARARGPGSGAPTDGDGTASTAAARTVPGP
jgi:8-oxo-dGTP pyrophosphatase MutT (NUDIX family)